MIGMDMSYKPKERVCGYGSTATKPSTTPSRMAQSHARASSAYKSTPAAPWKRPSGALASKCFHKRCSYAIRTAQLGARPNDEERGHAALAIWTPLARSPSSVSFALGAPYLSLDHDA